MDTNKNTGEICATTDKMAVVKWRLTKFMKILHLYHDIMNLYGEYGNISALNRMLEKNNITCEVDRLSLQDNLELADYDFIYVGSGTENNQKYVMEHLSVYKEEIKQYIEAGKLLLMTGNSFEMLGSQITDTKGKVYEGLGLFNFTTTEQERTRTTADAIFTMEGNDRPLVGFINKCSTIAGIENPLFTVKMGLANETQGKTEGIRHKNFFGTHLTGPMLVKNPYFLEYLTTILCSANEDVTLTTDHLQYEKAGYEVTLRELGKRLEA